MDLRSGLMAEFRLRANLLPKEIERWAKLTDANVEGMGIHKTQVDTIKIFLDAMLSRQDEAVRGFTSARDLSELAARRAAMERALTLAHAVAGTFRSIFLQREQIGPDDEASFGRMLRAADLVAADCYLYCMRRWLGRPAEQIPEPPLTYLNARPSPAAAARGNPFKVLEDFRFDGFSQLLLPISVVSLRYHDAAVVWSLCSLYHEVGHLVDKSIGLVGTLGSILEESLRRRGTSDKNMLAWRTWFPEIVADVFGVMLGGVGFIYALMRLSLDSGERIVDNFEVNSHPWAYIRILLIVQVAKAVNPNNMWSQDIEGIEQIWGGLYGNLKDGLSLEEKNLLDGLVNDISTVVDVLLASEIQTENGAKSLKDIDSAVDLEERHKARRRLARALAENNVSAGKPEGWEVAPRDIPAAAQLAILAMQNKCISETERIHQQALEGLQQALGMEFLGADEQRASENRHEYLRRLAHDVQLPEY